MTLEEKRIKIAEACGWKRHYNTDKQWRYDGDGPDDWIVEDDLPNYFNSLDACHEMEKVLKDHEIEQYNDLLGSFLWSGYPASRRNFHATAAQRAEAFGRTLGLWTSE